MTIYKQDISYFNHHHIRKCPCTLTRRSAHGSCKHLCTRKMYLCKLIYPHVFGLMFFRIKKKESRRLLFTNALNDRFILIQFTTRSGWKPNSNFIDYFITHQEHLLQNHPLKAKFPTNLNNSFYDHHILNYQYLVFLSILGKV